MVQDIDALERLSTLVSKLNPIEDTNEIHQLLEGAVSASCQPLRIPRHFVFPDYEISMFSLAHFHQTDTELDFVF